MPILLGQKDAKCPECGGIVFVHVPTGRVKVTPQGQVFDVQFRPGGLAFLCANPECELRPLSLEEVKEQMAPEKRIIDP